MTIPPGNPSGIVNYNKLRFIADTVDVSDRTQFLVDMPKGFTRFFLGAFSLLLDPNSWESANGVTKDQMSDIANNEVIFLDLCEFVADCIRSSDPVRDALQNAVREGINAGTIIDETNYSNTVLIAQGADSNGCGKDDRYGRIDALVDYIDQVQLDFFESIDAALNVIGEVSNLVSAIPLFETLPFDELIATIADTGEQWEDSYTASVNTQLLEDFKCQLWCDLVDCNVTLKDIRQKIEERYDATSTTGSLNLLTLAALIARISTTVAAAGGLTYIGDDFVYLSWLLQIVAVEASGEFFGVDAVDYVRESSNGTPSGLWTGCTPCPSPPVPFSITWKFDKAPSGSFEGFTQFTGASCGSGQTVNVTIDGIQFRADALALSPLFSESTITNISWIGSNYNQFNSSIRIFGFPSGVTPVESNTYRILESSQNTGSWTGSYVAERLMLFSCNPSVNTRLQELSISGTIP